MRDEEKLKLADERERNNTCPLCGGRPTTFRESPNRCQDCDLPVVHWEEIRQMKAVIDRNAAAYDEQRINTADYVAELQAELATAKTTIEEFCRTLDKLGAERDEARALNKRALAIISDAIVHGMPVTQEVADVRNAIMEATT